MSDIALPSGAVAIDENTAKLSLPPGAVPAEKNIDMVTGADALARMRVGGVNINDKLSTAQQHYPDAQPYGDDNFIFTHPITKRPTLFNPPGLDFGDAAGSVREAAQMVGSGVATAAAAAAMPVTGGTSAFAIPAASGLGMAGGGALYDWLAQNLGGVPDTRSVARRLVDTGVDTATGVAGQKFGDMINIGGKKLMGVGKDALTKMAAQRAKNASDININLPAGAASGSNVIQASEQALANAPGSTSIIQETANKTLQQADDAARNVALKFGPGAGKEEAGSRIVASAKGALERFSEKQGIAYDAAYDLVGKNTLSVTSSVKKLLAEMNEELAAAPNALKPHLQSAIKSLEALADDAVVGLPFNALRQVRTAIGKNLKDPLSSGATGSQNIAMKRVYGALTNDMNTTANAAGGKALKKIQIADRYTRLNNLNNVPLLKEIAKHEAAAEKAVTYVVSGMKDGGSRLARLRRNFKAEEWNDVSSHVLAGLGRKGDDFSVSTFMTNWNNISKGARKSLFEGTQYKTITPYLNKLTDTLALLKRTEAMGNPSGTGRALAYMSILGVFGGSSGYSLGDVEGAAAGVGMSILLPRQAAKLITSPKFLKWITSAPSNIASNPNALTAHLSKLVGVAKVAPEIREEIHQYMAATQGSDY
tara:strand:- start:8319 stop:10271 length:1953 start_codon:yes stop_codon:yes gene_type:complete